MPNEHTGHIGDATYVAYAQLGCRHPDCLAAFNDYKLRLAERKLSGQFRDMRVKGNQAAALIENLRNDPELLVQVIPVLRGTAEVVRDERNVQAEPQTEAAADPVTPLAEEPAEGRQEPETVAAIEAPKPVEMSADEVAVLAYLTRFAFAGGRVLDTATEVEYATSMTGLPETRLMAAIKGLRAAGKVRVDEAGSAWIAAA